MRRTKVVPGGLLAAKNVMVLNGVFLAVLIALSPVMGLGKKRSKKSLSISIRRPESQ
jgi:hypothetical protein